MQSANPYQNHLLAALPEEEMKRWLPKLERVDLNLGDVLHESGAVQSHVYFPTTAIVSLLYVLDTGASAEIAIVGNEGLVGISLFMGGGSTINRAVIQSAGEGYRLPAAMLAQDFQRPPVLHLLLRYTQAPGPAAGRQARDDAGTHCQHARRAPGGCDRRRVEAATSGADPVRPRTHHCARQAAPGAAELRVL